MGDTKICDLSPDVKDELKKFRFRKNLANAALIIKIDREKKLVIVDEQIDDITLDELREQLPEHQPRYIIYSYKMLHEDQRISYPMCFIFHTPRDSQIELQILYAGTKNQLQNEAELTRCYEIRELEDLTEDWLKDQLR